MADQSLQQSSNKAGTGKIIIIVVVLVIACCIIVPLTVICLLALLGPAVGNVFSNIVITPVP